MNHESDEQLRRLFAAAPVVGPDEAYVAALSADVAMRRRGHRPGLMAVWLIVIAGLSVWLAPYAPSALLKLPVVAQDVVESRADTLYTDLQLPFYFYLALSACILPLAGALLLMRRQS